MLVVSLELACVNFTVPTQLIFLERVFFQPVSTIDKQQLVSTTTTYNSFTEVVWLFNYLEFIPYMLTSIHLQESSVSWIF